MAHRPLYLFGAGHVGRALALALAPLPYAVRWIDGRDGAFPQAVPGNVTCIQSANPVQDLQSATDGSFVLIMTHSHALDLAVTEAALRDARFAYVGLIGSATKRARFEKRLREGGVPPDTDRRAGLSHRRARNQGKAARDYCSSDGGAASGAR